MDGLFIMLEIAPYAKLKNLIGLNEALITAYPVLEDIKESVYYRFEDELNRVLESGSYSETLYVDEAGRMISLPALPVATVTSVTIEGVASTDYKITNYGIRFNSDISNSDVVVSYTGGYATVPSALERAAIFQIVYEFQNHKNLGATSVTTDGGGTVTTPELGLLKEVKLILNKFHHPLAFTL